MITSSIHKSKGHADMDWITTQKFLKIENLISQETFRSDRISDSRYNFAFVSN